MADSTGLLVKADVATTQMEMERPAAGAPLSQPGSPTPKTGGTHIELGDVDVGGRSPTAPPKLKRFHATVRLDASRIGRDAGRIAEEVVQHLALLPDSKVDVVLEIQAELPAGTPENVVRMVTENCRTLKFTSQRFEQE